LGREADFSTALRFGRNDGFVAGMRVAHFEWGIEEDLTAGETMDGGG
jgi:hypothetical protein